jgi:type IV secretion system protein VirB2
MITQNTIRHITGSILCLLGSSTCWAYADTPVNKGLGYITDALLGGTGITIATLAMMGTGLACLFHKMEWKFFGYTVAGIGIVFGAPAIVSAIVSLVK